jgi:hypothetical protein
MRPPGLAARAFLRLPEDRFPSLHLREHELGASTTGTIEHEIDRCSAPAAEQDGNLLDDLSLGGPDRLDAVAVDTGGRRPRLPRLQHQPILEREQQQVGQLAVSVWVTGDEEHPAALSHAAVA